LQEQYEASARRLSSLKGSPDAITAEHFQQTQEQRRRKVESIYPMIEANAARAKAALVAVRQSLGDELVIPLEETPMQK
jgi:hypothetical protein